MHLQDSISINANPVKVNPGYGVHQTKAFLPEEKKRGQNRPHEIGIDHQRFPQR